MPHIKDHLIALNAIEPISKQFSNLLSKLLTKHTKEDKYTFLEPGQIAKKAWTLLSGFIIAFYPDHAGNQMVMDIYSKGATVMDLQSFYKNEPVVYKFVAIGKVEVLEFKKEDAHQLEQFRETDKLAHSISLKDSAMRRDKDLLHKLQPKERIIRFFKTYQVSGLPIEYCASFLDLTLEKYIELKLKLVKSEEIDLSPGTARTEIDTHEKRLVYQVETYLQANYTRTDLPDIVEISASFNTSKKTLTRYFREILGMTVVKKILELRMEMALMLLSSEKRSVKDVYHKVGYKDVYYFSRKFKTHFGFSAKEAITRSIS